MVKSLHLLFVIIALLIGGCGARRQASTAPVPGEDQARELVMRFIDAYYTWEKSAYGRARSTTTATLQGGVYMMTEEGRALHDQLKQEYVDALEPLVADDVNLCCPGWGIPLKHDPSYESVSSVKRADTSLIVQTTMTREHGSWEYSDRYEYRIDGSTHDFRLQSIVQIFDDGERYEALSYKEPPAS